MEKDGFFYSGENFSSYSTVKNLCSVEISSGENKAELFFREEDGSIRKEERTFSPFILLERESLAAECFQENTYILKELEGAGVYSFQAFFSSYASYEEALKKLKLVTGFPPEAWADLTKYIPILFSSFLLQKKCVFFPE